MNQSVDEQLSAAIVSLYKQDGSVAGMGFLIDDSHIITCAHVMDIALGRKLNSLDPPEDSVNFAFPLIAAQSIFSATVVSEGGWHSQEQNLQGDIAVLEIEEGSQLPALSKPILLLIPENVWGHEFRAYGCPRGMEVGVWASGQMRAASIDHGLMQIEDTKTPGYRVQPGFSGSPVWDTNLKGVVGMVALATSDPQIKAAFILPTQMLFNAWPPLRSQQGRNLRQRWLDSEDKERSRLLNEKLNRNDIPGSVASPLQHVWREFIQAPAWHETLVEKVEAIKEQIEFVHRGAKRLSISDNLEGYLPVQGKALAGTYEEILTNMSGWHKPEVVRPIVNLIDRITPSCKDSKAHESLRSQAVHVLALVNDLRQFLRSPLFARCFPVLGSWGAGRTHFLTTLLGSQHDPVQSLDRNYLLLPLSLPDNYVSIKELVLTEICRATGIDWPTLEAFDAHLQGTWVSSRNRWLWEKIRLEPEGSVSLSRLRDDALKQQDGFFPPRLVVAIDDFEGWLQRYPAYRNELIRSVKELTAFPSFYWIIILQDTEYLAAAQNAERFWPTYSHLPAIDPSDPSTFRSGAPSQANLGGWLLLDVLNRQAKLGPNIIKEQLSDFANKDILLEALKEDDPAFAHIANPIIAWILLDLRDTLPLETIINLRFIEFVEHFWQKRRATLPPTRFTATDLSQAIYLLVRGIIHARSVELEPERQQLLQFVVRLAAEKGSIFSDLVQAQEALGIFAKAGLVQEYERINQKDIDWQEIGIRLQFEPFWEFHLARYFYSSQAIKQRNETDLKLNWRELFGNSKQLFLAEGVLEFLLLLLDTKPVDVPPIPSYFQQAVWELSLRGDHLPTTAAWFAASKVSHENQNFVATWALSHKGEPLQDRQLFAYTHFLGNAQPDTLGVPARLRLMRPYFDDLGKLGLAFYCFHIIQRLITPLDNPKVVLECMKILSGSEALGIAEDLAELMVAKIVSLCKDDDSFITQANQIVTDALDYLRYEDRKLDERSDLTAVTNKWRRASFYEWVASEFCRQIVRKVGLSQALQMLKQRNWYQPQALGLSSKIGLVMEREANIVLGFFYRTARDDDEKHGFADGLKLMLKSPGKRWWKLAFHLIRHTRPTEDQSTIRVNDEFLPLLEQIAMEPELADFVSRFEKELFIPTFGLPEMQALKRKRQRLEKRQAEASRPANRQTKPKAQQRKKRRRA